jgi:hypothetical protein
MVSEGFPLLELLENKNRQVVRHSREAQEDMLPDYLNEQVIGGVCIRMIPVLFPPPSFKQVRKAYHHFTPSGINKVPAHVPLLALASEEEARTFRLEDGWQDTMFQHLLTPPNTRYTSTSLPFVLVY